MKKLFALLFCAIMALSVCSCEKNEEAMKDVDTNPVNNDIKKEREKNPMPEAAAPDACGENLTWRFDENTETLFIEGKGDMWDFVYWDEDAQDFSIKDTPWLSLVYDIKNIYIGDEVTSVGDYAFSYCADLASVKIPDSVTYIGDVAFYSCESLTSIEISDNVTTIGDGAFFFCESLTSIEIPDSVTSVGDEVFFYCSALANIKVSSENKNYCDTDGVLFSKDKKTIICYPEGKTDTKYVIPDNVTTIGDYAFSSCSALTSIEMPDSLTTIGNGAFFYCESLENIEIPESVTTIGDGAFYSCASLKSIKIPENLTTIPDGAVYQCASLKIIEIPESITTIGNEAFYSCESLASIRFAGTKEQWEALGIEPKALNNAEVRFGEQNS